MRVFALLLLICGRPAHGLAMGGIDKEEFLLLSAEQDPSFLPFNFLADDFARLHALPHGSPRLDARAVLVVVTTCNNFAPLRRLLFNLAQLQDEFDVLVVDDGGADNTTAFLASMRIPHVPLDSAGGLARSWNYAWDYFLVRQVGLELAGFGWKLCDNCKAFFRAFIHRQALMLMPAREMGDTHHRAQ
jgi:hypothetical protein